MTRKSSGNKGKRRSNGSKGSQTIKTKPGKKTPESGKWKNKPKGKNKLGGKVAKLRAGRTNPPTVGKNETWEKTTKSKKPKKPK